MTTIPCLRCGEDFDIGRRRASHFCQACRVIRNRERTAARWRETEDLRQNAREITKSFILGGMSGDYVETVLYPRVDEYIGELESGDDYALVPDRMPDGANSPAGPDDGISTYFTDLAEELDWHHREVARHPWFAANPHWAYRLHDETVEAEHLRVA